MTTKDKLFVSRMVLVTTWLQIPFLVACMAFFAANKDWVWVGLSVLVSALTFVNIQISKSNVKRFKEELKKENRYESLKKVG